MSDPESGPVSGPVSDPESDPVSDLLPDAVLRYAEHEDGLLDVHLPRRRTRGTVVVLVHGGFWKTAYDRRHTRPMARALADAGFVVVTPEYRRVGPGGHGGWPQTAEDVRRATERLPALLAGIDIGFSREDALQLIGHSAGGHLALWLAATQADPALRVARTVGLAPVCDLRAAIDQRLGSDAARAFLGDAADAPDLAGADPATLLDRRPLGEVHVIHGIADDVVPVELSRGLAARHPWIRLTELPTGHFELIDPDDAAFTTVLTALC